MLLVLKILTYEVEDIVTFDVEDTHHCLWVLRIQLCWLMRTQLRCFSPGILPVVMDLREAVET